MTNNETKCGIIYEKSRCGRKMVNEWFIMSGIITKQFAHF